MQILVDSNGEKFIKYGGTSNFIKAMKEEINRYKISDQLQFQIDWDNIMKMERCEGGHDEQMRGLFKNSKVIGHWNEGNWQGTVATCVQLETGEFVIYNDYYGSCSGCDSWVNASDEGVKNMCINLANGARIFNSLDDVKEFLADKGKEGWSWEEKECEGLLNAIKNG